MAETLPKNTLPKNIGFVGLGLMGYPMAKNLVKKMDKDTHFFVYDVLQENLDKFIGEEDGKGRIHACASSREVADKADVLFSMVPEGSHVRSVYLDETDGVLTSPNLSNKFLVDCSTIDTATSLAVRDVVSTRHPHTAFYDAPVSGGVVGAERGSLTFMLGTSSSDPHVSLLRTILSLMGGNIFECGGPSLGLTAKLCNNYASGLIAIAVSEAMNTGIRSGMDPRVLANIFHTSTAQTAICDDWCGVPGLCPDAPGSKGYAGGFRVQLMRKDFGLAVDAAKRVGAKLALGKAGLDVYEGASQDEQCQNRDSRVVYRYLGGVEDWNKDGKFPEKVNMKRDETRKLKELGRQALAEQQRQ